MNGCVRYIQLRNFLNIFRVNIVKILIYKKFFLSIISHANESICYYNNTLCIYIQLFKIFFKTLCKYRKIFTRRNINIEKFLFSFTYLKSVSNIVFKCQIVDTQIGKIVIFVVSVTEELDIAR